MTPKTLITLLFALATLPVSAQTHADDQAVFTRPLMPLAQTQREEQRALRERWAQATPEERAQMRRVLRERLHQGTPGNPATHKPIPGKGWREDGFGMGFEARQAGDERLDTPSRERRGTLHRPSPDR